MQIANIKQFTREYKSLIIIQDLFRYKGEAPKRPSARGRNETIGMTRSGPTPRHQDTAFSWLVAFCGFVSNVIILGCSYSYGVLFPELLQEFRAGKATTGERCARCRQIFRSDERLTLNSQRRSMNRLYITQCTHEFKAAALTKIEPTDTTVSHRVYELYAFSISPLDPLKK